jgi:hypothetical protein
MRTVRWAGTVAGTAAAVIAALVVAGCATPTGTGSGGQPAGTPTGGVPSASPSPTTGASPQPQSNPPAPAPAAVRLVINRTGGFAGVNETITIEPDGSWVYNGSERGRLTAAQLADIMRLVRDPRLASEMRAPNQAVCNDAFRYTFRIGELSGSFEDCANRPAVNAVLTAIGQATPF